MGRNKDTTETGFVQPISSGKQVSMTLWKNKYLFSGLVQRLRWLAHISIPSSFLLIVLPIFIVFGITTTIPNILAVILALNISFGLTLLLAFMFGSMLLEISLSLSVSLIAFCVTIYLFSSSHRELVCFVEFYCRCIVNSSELMEIPFLHIKLPIPYNRLFPMSNFIKSTVPPHRLCAGENVKKRWDTARSKERNMRPDDLCFFQYIDSLLVWEQIHCGWSYLIHTERNTAGTSWSKASVRTHQNTVWDNVWAVAGMSNIKTCDGSWSSHHIRIAIRDLRLSTSASRCNIANVTSSKK